MEWWKQIGNQRWNGQREREERASSSKCVRRLVQASKEAQECYQLLGLLLLLLLLYVWPNCCCCSVTTLSGRGPAFFSFFFFSSFVQRRRESETPQADGKKKKKKKRNFLSFFLLCLRVVFLLFTFALLPAIHLLTLKITRVQLFLSSAASAAAAWTPPAEPTHQQQRRRRLLMFQFWCFGARLLHHASCTRFGAVLI